MAGQTHHFRQYAPAMVKDQRQLSYGVRRYTDEVRRLYSVLDRRLADRDYVAGDYSIADMAIWPWIVPHRNQGQHLDRTPHLKAWFERVGARDAVQKGFALGRDLRGRPGGGRSPGRGRAPDPVRSTRSVNQGFPESIQSLNRLIGFHFSLAKNPRIARLRLTLPSGDRRFHHVIRTGPEGSLRGNDDGNADGSGRKPAPADAGYVR
jgi:hypothetical protein